MYLVINKDDDDTAAVCYSKESMEESVLAMIEVDDVELNDIEVLEVVKFKTLRTKIVIVEEN